MSSISGIFNDSSNDMTALERAAQNNQRDIVELLLRQGVTPEGAVKKKPSAEGSAPVSKMGGNEDAQGGIPVMRPLSFKRRTKG